MFDMLNKIILQKPEMCPWEEEEEKEEEEKKNTPLEP